MRPSWMSELLQGEARDLTPDGVEAGDRDGLGGVVDNEVAARERFDAADVAALAADDAALHLVVGEGDDGDGDFACMVGGAALDGGGDDLFGSLVSLVLELCLDLLDLHGHLVGDLVADVGDEVGLRLFHGEAGDLFQHFKLALLHKADLLLLRFGGGDFVLQGLVLLLGRVDLLVQVLLLLLKAALLLGQLCSAFLDFPLVLGAASVYLFLCLYKRLSLLALGALDRFIYNPSGLLLGARDLALGDLLAVGNACPEARGGQDDHQNDG